MKKFVALFLISLLSYSVLADNQAETFQVKIYGAKYRVIAPSKVYPKQTVIFENKTRTRVVGKIIYGKDSRLESFVNILPGKFKTIELGNKLNDELIFIPLSPPFQEFKLLANSKDYEIPTKK